MPSFATELESLWRERERELGRDLSPEEGRILEGELFDEWIREGRQDELIRVIHANFPRDGGTEEIQTIAFHLRQAKDAERIHSLFRGLISRRVKAFHEWWPRASAGHVGCMQAAVSAMSNAMDVYVEYFLSLESLGLSAERDALRAEMLRFQGRQPAAKVLARTNPQ